MRQHKNMCVCVFFQFLCTIVWIIICILDTEDEKSKGVRRVKIHTVMTAYIYHVDDNMIPSSLYCHPYTKETGYEYSGKK